MDGTYRPDDVHQLDEIYNFFREMSETQFERDFLPFAVDDTFAAVASGVGSNQESRALGQQFVTAGIPGIDPDDSLAVLRATRAITKYVYDHHYHP